MSNTELSRRRDERVRDHLAQYAPVWMLEEESSPEEEILIFNVLFQHPTAGPNGSEAWVSRRYRYDGFNNVLHHRGQTVVDESEILEMLDKDPYLTTRSADIPNSYGG